MGESEGDSELPLEAHSVVRGESFLIDHLDEHRPFGVHVLCCDEHSRHGLPLHCSQRVKVRKLEETQHDADEVRRW